MRSSRLSSRPTAARRRASSESCGGSPLSVFRRSRRSRRVATELRGARSELAALAGTQADQLLKRAELLEAALGFHTHFPGTTCPVCGTEEVLTDEWARAAEQSAAEQKADALEARRAKARADRALAQARDIVTSVPGRSATPGGCST